MIINETVKNNIPIITIDTKKFKTFTLRVSFRNELDKDTVTARNLLARMMIKRTMEQDSESKLVQYLAQYYGADLTYQTTKLGSSHVVHFTLEFVNERFIPEKLNILEDLSKFMNDMLLTPFNYDESTQRFMEKEKRLYKNKLKSLMDNSMQRAYVSMLNTMFQDSDQSILSFGNIDEIDDITIDYLKSVHKSMMKEDEMVILLTGDIHDDSVESLSNIYSRENIPSINYEGYKTDISKTVQYKTDHEQVEQSKSILGFKIDKEHTDLMSVRVLNRMFGGGASSYLFKHLREERSLAYQIHSDIDVKNGYIFAMAGVDHSRVKETETNIIKELEKFQNGEFSISFLEETKNKMRSDRKNVMDKEKGLINLVYSQYLNNTTEADFIERLNNVTHESVINAAKHVHLDTVYSLTGGENNDS